MHSVYVSFHLARLAVQNGSYWPKTNETEILTQIKVDIVRIE